MPGKMPEKKSFGRREPPQSHPIDHEQYADPQNYMYPLDKPIRAKLARRYFDEPRNRSKYTEDERLFIDSRNRRSSEMLRYWAEEVLAMRPRTDRRKLPKRISRNEPGKPDLEALLQRFLGNAHLARTESIPDNLVSLSGLDATSFPET